MSEIEFKDGRVTAVPTRQPSAAASTAAASSAADESFGRALAAARQVRGMSQGDVAAQLRLQLRQVRAIEADDLDALPEGPFVRGFVRNYARLVGIPAEPLLELLAARLKPTEPLPADGSGAAVSPVQLAAREHFSRLTVVGGAVVLLLLFAVLGWWTMRSVTPEPTAVAVPPPAPRSSAPAQPPAPETAVARTPETNQEAEAALPLVEGNGEGVSASATALQFNFREQSWVEVRQADGSLLMSRLNDGGTQEMLDGRPPYTLVIGNASKVDLEYRGKPVDLSAIASREDVARLRLE